MFYQLHNYYHLMSMQHAGYLQQYLHEAEITHTSELPTAGAFGGYCAEMSSAHDIDMKQALRQTCWYVL